MEGEVAKIAEYLDRMATSMGMKEDELSDKEKLMIWTFNKMASISSAFRNYMEICLLLYASAAELGRLDILAEYHRDTINRLKECTTEGMDKI